MIRKLNHLFSDSGSGELSHHYSEIASSLTQMADWEQLIQMDDREELFQSALKQFSHISAASVMKYLPLTFNVNRCVY